MARIDKSALTKAEIIAEATKQFLEKGYSRTTVSAIAKELSMSPGNLTFHYPTKEHMDLVREHGPSPIHRKSFLKFLDK